MKCSEIQEQMADYLGDELDADARAAFGDHVATCEACREEIGALEETVSALEKLKVVNAPAFLPARRVGAQRWLAYAAVLLIGVGVGWLIKPGEVRNRRPGMHPAWVSAAMGSATGEPAKPSFARNLTTFARALAQSSR